MLFGVTSLLLSTFPELGSALSAAEEQPKPTWNTSPTAVAVRKSWIWSTSVAVQTPPTLVGMLVFQLSWKLRTELSGRYAMLSYCSLQQRGPT